MKKIILATIATVLIGMNIFMYLDPPYADLIISGKNILTLDSDNPVTDYIAMRNGKIIWVGNKDQAKSLIDPTTKIIELEDHQIAVPGIHESHGHLFGIGLSLLTLDASKMKTEEELNLGIQKLIDKSAIGDWILVRGWHQEKLKLKTEYFKGYPSNDTLNLKFKDNPVVLIHSSYHMIMANEKAIQLANINSNDLSNKEIIKNKSGVPSGIFLENSKSLILEKIQNSKERLKTALSLSIDHIVSMGITSFHDMGLGFEEAKVLAEYLVNNELKINLYAYVDSREIESFGKIKELLKSKSNRVRVQGIKVFVDGALGTRTAWLSKSYSDDKHNHGKKVIDDAQFEIILNKIKEENLQLAAHAIGDKASDYLFDKIEDKKLLKPRIEHFQLNRKDQRIRLKKLNGIASMQGVHYTSDKSWAVKRIGQKRFNEIGYVWQKVLEDGILLLNGTDAPVESVNPLNSLFAFVSDKVRKIGFIDALKTYSLNPAIAVGAKKSGMLKLGFQGDISIYSNDLRQVSKKQYDDTHALFTIVGGDVVYEKK